MLTSVQVHQVWQLRLLRFLQKHVPALVGPALRVQTAWMQRGQQQLQVPMRTLSSLLQEFGVSQVDLLKVDVEGAELQVCRSFMLGFSVFVFFDLSLNVVRTLG